MFCSGTLLAKVVYICCAAWSEQCTTSIPRVPIRALPFAIIGIQSVVRLDLGQMPLLAAAGRCAGWRSQWDDRLGLAAAARRLGAASLRRLVTYR
jgi:hypothetical protein